MIGDQHHRTGGEGSADPPGSISEQQRVNAKSTESADRKCSRCCVMAFVQVKAPALGQDVFAGKASHDKHAAVAHNRRVRKPGDFGIGDADWLLELPGEIPETGAENNGYSGAPGFQTFADGGCGGEDVAQSCCPASPLIGFLAVLTPASLQWRPR